MGRDAAGLADERAVVEGAAVMTEAAILGSHLGRQIPEAPPCRAGRRRDPGAAHADAGIAGRVVFLGAKPAGAAGLDAVQDDVDLVEELGASGPDQALAAERADLDLTVVAENQSAGVGHALAVRLLALLRGQQGGAVAAHSREVLLRHLATVDGDGDERAAGAIEFGQRGDPQLALLRVRGEAGSLDVAAAPSAGRGG